MNNNELEEILLNAGWFKGRKINIDNYMAWYQRYGFTPGISVLKILEEYAIMAHTKITSYFKW